MPETRSRLGDAEVAALARVSFGLGDAGPELPPADEYGPRIRTCGPVRPFPAQPFPGS